MLGKNTESFAILVHRNDATKVVEVTSHKVIPIDGGTFTLGAGRLFNQQDKDAMLDVFAGTQSGLSMVPAQVLAQDSSQLNMIWYKKAHKATVRFRDRSEHTVMLPTLIFIKKEAEPLRVFAAKGSSRPCTQTKLYVAPLGNINKDGTMCGGNVSVGTFTGKASSIAEFESFAIEAASTHLGNADPAKGISTQEDYQEFITNLAASTKCKPFPSNKLVPLTNAHTAEPITLADMLLGVQS